MEKLYEESLATGVPQSATNLGFRMHRNEMHSYTEERIGFGYFYCKRKILNDGINTEPLDMWLEPTIPNEHKP